MDRIEVLDKVFEKYIPHEQILEAIRRLAREIHSDMGDKQPLFLCVLNGSFMFAADLMKEYRGACEISFVRLSSYHGTQSTEEVKTLLGVGEEIRDREVVVLEDIIDSGITIRHLTTQLLRYGPASVRVATLLLKPVALAGKFDADYVGIEIPNDFVVGYGLDYDGFGRNTRDIYKII